MIVVGSAGIAAGGEQPTQALGSSLPPRMPESTGKSYFVDGAGGVDRSGRGSFRRPWRTITYALRRVPLRGSTILVRGGTYVEAIRYERRGDQRNPITLRPYDGEHVVLAAPPNSTSHAISIEGSALRIRGFEITSPGANNGIKIENGRDVEIVGCEIHHTGRTGLLVAGTGSSAPTGNRNVQVWNNRFHDNGGNSALGTLRAGRPLRLLGRDQLQHGRHRPHNLRRRDGQQPVL